MSSRKRLVPERSWDNMKIEFKVILDKLEGYSKSETDGAAKEMLSRGKLL